jgi:PKD repeat protein
MKVQIACIAHDWTFYSTSYFSDLEFVVDKVELLLALPPPLSASISPLSASINVGNSITFTSTVSGGTSPYSYQWYLDSNPVSGATSNSWAFTPTTSGIYYVYLKVTDAVGNTTQSETARITVASVPVGGYSISTQVHTKAEPIVPYIASVVALTAILNLRRKIKRKR